MSKEPTYFCFFFDYKIAFKSLNQRDKAKLTMALIEYAESGEILKEGSEDLLYSFKYIANRINQSTHNKIRTKSKNGSLGGRGNKKNHAKEIAIIGDKKPNKIKEPLKQDYIDLAQGLKSILENKMNKSFSNRVLESWGDEIRKLIEIDLKNRNDALESVVKVIQSIQDNYSKKFFPVVQSGSALREKFSAIENSDLFKKSSHKKSKWSF